MSLYSQTQRAFSQSQRLLAQMQGMTATAAGNFIAPDGQPYTLVFRSADAFEIQSVGREMTQHGYNERSVLVGTATRGQFSAPPLDWARKHGTKTDVAPALDCLIATVTDTDPHHFVFILLTRQVRPAGS